MSAPPATTVRYADVADGDELPPLDLPLTRSLIVATAIASRDYQDVHHDPDLAVDRGSPDIFMNILSTNAHCSRWLTDWAGPDAMVRKLAIRLGVPLMPGATLTFTGAITALAEDGDEGRVEVEFRATTDIGDHVTGTAALTLPLA